MNDYSKLGADIEAAMDGLVEGVRLVQDREARLARIDAAVSRGIEDAEAVLGRLRRKYEAANAKPTA